MFRLTRSASFILALAAAVVVPASAADDTVGVVVESPGPGVVVSGNLHHARIAGSAIAHAGAPKSYDVMMVVDVSGSTNTASGSDIDGDGTVGVNPHNELLPPGLIARNVLSTDPQDTILHAQAAAARSLLADLDSSRVRVGLITFAGEVNPVTNERKTITQQDAWVEAPLTHDFAQVERMLYSIVARGPRGATNFAAGVRLATIELNGLSGARSSHEPESEKIMLFLSDGQPSMPFGRGDEVDPGDEEAAIRAAELARRAGVVINTYALGPVAMSYPRALTEMARVSRGTYTPVQRPGEIVAMLGGVTFANVEDVVFTNLTTGDLSTDVKLNPDGSYSGYVPVRVGRNRVRVTALSSDGRRGDAEFEFEFEHKEFGDRADVAELERIRRQNKHLELQRLKLEIEEFREEQRRRVEIRVLDEDEAERLEAEEAGAVE